MVYSFSSLTEYEACPYSYYLRKKEGIQGETNGSAEIGSYAHKLLEQLIKGSITVTQALDDCVDNFFDYVTDDRMRDDYKEKKYMELCDYLSSLKQDTLKKYDVLGVEQMMWWNIGNYRMCGVIDLILRDKKTNEVILVDHKSSAHFLRKDGMPLKSQLQSFEKYKKQMYLYAYAIKEKYGYYPDKIAWNHFLDGGTVTVIPFNETDLRKTLDWAKEIIERIENDKEFPASQDDYLFCHRFCGYRNGLCEYKDLDEED